VNTGLTTRDVKTLFDIFKKYQKVSLVYIFGSRAIGNYKPGSDIDFAIMNTGVDDEVISNIRSDIEESNLPYFADIINYPTLQHKELKEHIDRVGIEFYKKENMQ
jgi:predicted nucleotidyltransferase